MLRAAAITRIQRGLGFRSDKTDEIISALQEAQRLLERGRTLPYFLLQQDQTFAVTSGSAGISLPTGFLREKDAERFHYINDDDTVFLEKLTHDIAVARFEDSDPGRPLAYVLRKSTVDIYPERDTSYSLTWSYYKSAVSLATNVENEWLEEELGNPEALIGRAGMIIAKDLENEKAFGVFQAMYSEAWLGGMADMIEREDEGMPVVMGGRL